MKTEDIREISHLLDLNPSEEWDLIQDVQRGLADIEAGRVTAHEEARDRLLARYEKP